MRPAAIGFCSERRYQYTAPRPVMPMKRPAAFTKEGPANKKKPAASTATVSLNEQIAEWRESAGKLTPEDESLVKARDKGKGEKWAKLRKEGALPDHITNLYDHPPKGALSQRAFRTELINKLFARTAEGNLILQTNDAWFVQAKAAYEERYRKRTATRSGSSSGSFSTTMRRSSTRPLRRARSWTKMVMMASSTTVCAR